MAVQLSEHLSVTCVFEEEGELSDFEASPITQEPGQLLSEEQKYRETVRGVRSYMGWHKIQEFEAPSLSADDIPFAGPRSQ